MQHHNLHNICTPGPAGSAWHAATSAQHAHTMQRLPARPPAMLNPPPTRRLPPTWVARGAGGVAIAIGRQVCCVVQAAVVNLRQRCSWGANRKRKAGGTVG